eukprot:7430013-Pyramimonas_sp.AAC.1
MGSAGAAGLEKSEAFLMGSFTCAEHKNGERTEEGEKTGKAPRALIFLPSSPPEEHVCPNPEGLSPYYTKSTFAKDLHA